MKKKKKWGLIKTLRKSRKSWDTKTWRNQLILKSGKIMVSEVKYWQNKEKNGVQEDE